MNLSLSIGPLVSLIAGILILLVPRLLNYPPCGTKVSSTKNRLVSRFFHGCRSASLRCLGLSAALP